MLLNTLRIGIRYIVKQKADSLIKLTGLSLGMSLFILLISFILDEQGYDRFHERPGRIQMITSAIGQGRLTVSSTPFLGGLMKQEFPEVERFARYWRIRSHVQAPNGEILEQNVALVDPSFFEIFTLPLKAGPALPAIDGPDSLVLNAATAVKFFGSANPLGTSLNLRLGSINKDFIINGVLEEFPGPSNLSFDMLISFANYPLLFGEEFPNSIVAAPFFHTMFIELRDGAVAADLQAKFPEFLRKYYG